MKISVPLAEPWAPPMYRVLDCIRYEHDYRLVLLAALAATGLISPPVDDTFSAEQTSGHFGG